MNVYPDGKKIIYHNGWWHGNNTVFIRMIQDSVTIIVLGNKYNRNIYQAKKMAEIFDPSSVLEDEEKPANIKDYNSTENTDLLLLKSPPPVKTTKHRVRSKGRRR